MLFKRCKCPDRTKCLHNYWYEFEVHGRRLQRSAKTANLRLADRTATNKKSALLESRAGIKSPKATKLTAHITDYVAHTEKTNVTSYKDQAVLDRLVDVVGDRPIADLTPFHLERWKTERVKDVSKSTVNRELHIVRGCFSRAVEWGVLTTSPATVVKDYKVDDHRVRVLDDDELRTVLCIGDPFVVELCRATLESLARISEVLGLRREHIGPTWMELRRKGGTVERVPITDTLRAVLLARCHESGAVWGEDPSGVPPTQQTATNRVLRALQHAGIQNASHHTMRHTGVTMMLEAGVNPRVIQRLAGWSSLRMLERYGHARDAEAVRAINVISARLDTVPTETPTATDHVGTEWPTHAVGTPS